MTEAERKTLVLTKRRLEEMQLSTDATNTTTQVSMGRLSAKHRELDRMVAFVYQSLDKIDKRLTAIETTLELVTSGDGSSTTNSLSRVSEIQNRLKKLEHYLWVR
jgi:hypothetical protein